MIQITDAEKIHEIILNKFGGRVGIRDRGGLISALSRPFQTFNKQELYPSILENQLRF